MTKTSKDCPTQSMESPSSFGKRSEEVAEPTTSRVTWNLDEEYDSQELDRLLDLGDITNHVEEPSRKQSTTLQRKKPEWRAATVSDGAIQETTPEEDAQKWDPLTDPDVVLVEKKRSKHSKRSKAGKKESKRSMKKSSSIQDFSERRWSLREISSAHTDQISKLLQYVDRRGAEKVMPHIVTVVESWLRLTQPIEAFGQQEETEEGSF